MALESRAALPQLVDWFVLFLHALQTLWHAECLFNKNEICGASAK